MLKDAHTYPRVLVPVTIACFLLFAFTPTALAASHDRALSSQLVGTKQYYLALGDSLAFGFQPNGDFTHGYVDDLFQILQQEGVKTVANMGCPGETSVTFIQGGCPSATHHFQYTGPQLTAAVDFLKANPGKVSLVTLDIGANDVLPDLNASTCMPNSDKFNADLATLDANLTGTILPALYNALTPKGHITSRIVMMNYYDPFQPFCPNTVPFTETLNQHLATDVTGFGTIVDVFTAFDGNATICQNTWMCSIQDIHPNNLGYSVIANTFAAAIG